MEKGLKGEMTLDGDNSVTLCTRSIRGPHTARCAVRRGMVWIDGGGSGGGGGRPRGELSRQQSLSWHSNYWPENK